MSKPATRLHLALYEYESEINRFQRLETAKDGAESKTPLDVAWFLVSDSNSVAQGSYLAGDRRHFAVWSRIAAESVSHYLFGDWRKKQKHADRTIDPQRWFRQRPSSANMTWVMYLEYGLCWATVGRHWDLVDKLLLFPEATIESDERGSVARGYYLGLATWWRDARNLNWIEEVKGLRGAGSKAYHLLCDIAAAIAATENPVLERALRQYVKLFVKRREHEYQFPIAGTFLWHVARYRGLRPDLAEETAKYIFTPLDEL